MVSKKLQLKDIQIVNLFSRYKNKGDVAEKYLRKNYFETLSLYFRKIRKSKEGKKPEGYVLDKNNKKIALVEIKCIIFKDRGLTERVIFMIRQCLNKKLPGGGYFMIKNLKCLGKQTNDKEFKKKYLNNLIEINNRILVGDYFEIILNKVKKHRT